MSETDETPFDRMLDAVTWEQLPPPENKHVLHATHRGTLGMFGFDFTVFVLSNGQRVFEAGDVEKFFTSASDVKSRTP